MAAGSLAWETEKRGERFSLFLSLTLWTFVILEFVLVSNACE